MTISRKSLRGNSAHFLALRRRLDAMGYQDYPLGLDSAPLAQIMLEDLVATTEALKDSEESSDSILHRLELAEQLLEPLQEENTRLRRDNVQLHQQMIKVGEENIKTENKLATSTFSLQAENRRLNLSKIKLEEQVCALNNELASTKIKLQQALEPILNGSSKSNSSKKQIKDSAFSVGDGGSAKSNLAGLASHSNDNFLSSSEIEALTQERDLLKTQLRNQVANNEEIKACIKLRDDVIEKLSEEIQKETGKDGYLLTLRYKYQKAEEEIEKLRCQVRLVNPGASIPEKKTYRLKNMVITPVRYFEVINESNAKVPSGRTRVASSSRQKNSRSAKSNENSLLSSSSNETVGNLQAENSRLKDQLSKKEMAVSDLMCNLAFIGDNIKMITNTRHDNDAATIQKLEDELNKIKTYYENEVQKQRDQMVVLTDPNDEVAKLIMNTSNLDNAFVKLPDKLEIENLKKQLEEANQRLLDRPNMETKYKNIIEKLRQEHIEMRNKIEEQNREIAKLKAMCK